jgi:putative methanogenesis marker 16 metalloprotein
MNADYERLLDINARLARGEAVVMSVQEFKSSLRQGKRYELKDIDIITTATHGIMSGTAAAFSVDVAKPASFRKAKRAWLNGVPCEPGPAPNERLGAVDLIVHGTKPSLDAPKSYGGGHLFRDLVERQSVQLEVETDTGARIRREVMLDEFDFARIFSTRNAFKDYMVFGNFLNPDPVTSIFSPIPMTIASGLTAVGCGEFNPIQNDPHLRTIRAGSLVFVNDAPGIILGEGTRSKPARPNLSLAADMREMDPYFMGGVCTPEGPEILNGVAIPLPILDERMLEDVSHALDANLALPIADVSNRTPFARTTYGEVWEGRDIEVSCDLATLASCSSDCRCSAVCPVGALKRRSGMLFDPSRCVNCGACVSVCTSGAMTGNFGSITVDGNSYRIAYRTSDRARAALLAHRLKERFIDEALLLPIPATFK